MRFECLRKDAKQGCEGSVTPQSSIVLIVLVSDTTVIDRHNEHDRKILWYLPYDPEATTQRSHFSCISFFFSRATRASASLSPPWFPALRLTWTACSDSRLGWLWSDGELPGYYGLMALVIVVVRRHRTGVRMQLLSVINHVSKGLPWPGHSSHRSNSWQLMALVSRGVLPCQCNCWGTKLGRLPISSCKSRAVWLLGWFVMACGSGSISPDKPDSSCTAQYSQCSANAQPMPSSTAPLLFLLSSFLAPVQILFSSCLALGQLQITF